MRNYSQWPYVAQAGRPNVAAQPRRSYPTVRQTNAYFALGHPPLPRKINHALHAILTFFTAGFWLPVWFTVMIVTHVGNSRAEADYWFKVEQYRRWELAQRGSAIIPPPRELPQGG